MAIARIDGTMLKANLLRQGVDFAVETDLLYFDVGNGRIGIQTNSPDQALHVIGGATVDNLSLTTNTITSIDTDGDINLNPNGTGAVTITGDILLTERSDHDFTPAATRGIIWLRDDGPNNLMFTDDGGTDFVIGGDLLTVPVVADLDGDTQIQVEESADEDKIRFDTGSSITGFPAQANALILSSQEFTLALPTADVATTVGGAISLTAGTGNTTGIGGAVNINSGDGGASAVGGAINLTAAAQGKINLVTSSSGTINITAGDSVGSGFGGKINLKAGRGIGASDGGAIALTAGSGEIGGTGPGGAILITSGGGGTSGADGGNIIIVCGIGSQSNDGGDIDITAGRAGEFGGTGGAVTIAGGENVSGSNGDGGAIDITGGVGGDDYSYGGYVTITGGTGTYYGGRAFLRGGNHVNNGYYGYGGEVFISGGNSDYGYGAHVNIDGGNSAGGNYRGGEIRIKAGDSKGTASAPSARITGGESIDGEGGGVSLIGTTGGTDKDGGDIRLSGGQGGPQYGPGGSIIILAGQSGGSGGGGGNDLGGEITITAGDSQSKGVGGAVTILAGDGGSSTGAGGAVNLTGGPATGGDSDGGDIVLTPGAGDGSGSAGAINIAQTTAPTSTTNKLYNVAGVLTWNGIDLTDSDDSNIIVDADGDTQIQVEESADEDKIRFDTGSNITGFPAQANALILSSQEFTLALPTADVATTVGGAISITAGQGNTTGNGGNFDITAGASGNGASGRGGNVNITGGQGVYTAGYVTIQGGYSTAYVGGAVELYAGNSNDFQGGPITIKAGRNINGGQSSGSIFIQSGNAAASSTGVGSVQMLGGSAGQASHTGGNVTVRAGLGFGAGVGGVLKLGGGLPGSVDGIGGGVTIYGGRGDGSGGGGAVTITAGEGQNGANSGVGGDLTISGGSGATSGGTGAGGDTIITSGTGGSTSGDAGDIVLTPGTATGGNSHGAVNIVQTTAPTSTTDKLYNVSGVLTWNGQVLLDAADIGVAVLAEQTIGIADDNLLEVDGSPNTAEYARFTANGLEGRTEAEFKADFNLETGVDIATAAQGTLADSALQPGEAIIISDADSDTQIQVEESADEDKIRFDTGSSITGFPAQANALILSSQEFTLALPTANVATTAGGAISLTAGTGNTTGDGGALTLTSGVDGGGATGRPGAITITAPDATSDLTTGAPITVSAGDGRGASSSGAGGAILIEAGDGDGSTTAPGGEVRITSGDAGTGNGGSGGQIHILAGRGTTNDFDDGGNIFVTAGEGYYAGKVFITGGAADGYNGGNVILTGGACNEANKDGGDIIIVGGTSLTGTASPGNVTIKGGPLGGGAGTAAGGDVLIFASNGGATGGAAGTLTLQGGRGGITTSTVDGGAVLLEAQRGASGATGDGGTVTITSGTSFSTDGSGGDIILDPGSLTGTGSAGAIIINQTTAPTSTTDKLYNVAGVLTWNGQVLLDAADIGVTVLAEQTIGITDNDLLEVDGSPNSAEYARFTANGLEGRTESEFKADFNLEIGTDVLAEQTIGIADDNLLEVDGTSNANEYARFTANGLVGRTEAEFKADFNLEIGTDVLAEQTIGIADDNLLEVDGLSNANEYARFTANGLVGRTEAEFKADFNLEIGTDVLAEQTIGITDNDLLEVDGSPNTAEYARFTAAGLEGRTEAEFKADFNLETGTDIATAAQGALADSALQPGEAIIISDADSDTQIQVEETADEDKIRFDTGSNITGFPAQANALILSSQEFTLALPTADVATTVGGAIALTAGTGNTSGNGGPINLTAGVGGATDGDGGQITITAGAGGATNSDGGDIVLTPGALAGSGADGIVSVVGTFDTSIEMLFTERADHDFTPVATRAILWVRNDAPNVPVFTDDAGTDHVLATKGFEGIISTAAATLTLDATHFTVVATLAGTQTFTLPTAVGIAGRIYNLKKTGASGTTTLDGDGSETIDGSLTYVTTTQYESVTVQSDGANWHII